MITNENGLKYAKLIHVSVDNGLTDNSNKYYIMEEQADGRIRCEYGRVGRNGTTLYKSSHEWNNIYRDKTSAKKGYKDVTELISEVVQDPNTKKVDDVEIIKEVAVKDLMRRLVDFANNSIKNNYTVSQESVTLKQIEEATKLVDEIIQLVDIGVDEKVINKMLMELYQVIPRRMDNVKNYLIGKVTDDKSLQNALSLINNEKDSLDTMAGQVLLAVKDVEDKTDVVVEDKTLLDKMGIDVTEVTDINTLKMIKEKLQGHAGKLHKAYKVVNHKTQPIFDKHLSKTIDKSTELLWHGSRNANWLSICQTGLKIRPSGAGYNGSMFGDGVYFADESDKSMGYTDGGRWVHGSRPKYVYLALFDVHLGKQFHFKEHTYECRNLSYKYIQDKDGYDSVFAHKGRSLYRNEFIIYNSDQTTIKYLIELKNT